MYQYGSESLKIENPFKIEGLLSITSGAFVFVIGIFSLLDLKITIQNIGLTAGWINLLISVALLIIGSIYLFKGFLKIFRFYVGRNVPSSLAKNLTPSEKHIDEPNTVYSKQDLDQMLMGRKNITFAEPKTFIDKLLYSLFPKLLFLPYPMRNYLNLLAKKIVYTLAAILIYFITTFSGTIGLTKLTEVYFSKWFDLLLLIFIFFTWCGNIATIGKTNSPKIESQDTQKFKTFIIFAILIPVVSEIAVENGLVMPIIQFDSTLYILMTLLLVCISIVAGVILASLRSKLIEPLTEVSEYKDHWQENMHPKDIFRSFEMEMANLRYLEVPNRTYVTLSPKLVMEGSNDKGSFSGDTMQETQPVNEPVKLPELFKIVRLIASSYGYLLLLLASVFLLVLNQNLISSLSVDIIIDSFYLPLAFFIFGILSINIAHIFWGEIFFKSKLVHLEGEGTYTESKISTGMSITDSIRSENQIVRTSVTPWALLSEIITSTFAQTGLNSLEGSRYIISMEKSDDTLEKITNGIRNYVSERQIIADINSEQDIATIGKNFSINQSSPANLGTKIIKAALDNKPGLKD